MREPCVPTIELELFVHAPIARVFDLCRSIELHTYSASQTGERAVAGVTTGLIGMNEEVTWEARHFGVRQRLTSRITAFDRPRHFRDSMVKGAFRRFDHDHDFVESNGGTLMRERFDFDAPYGVVGRLFTLLVLERYLRRFLLARMRVIKEVAESDRRQECPGLPGPS
jgi:ligand-binding SRPBCC domain-containing protein